MKINSLEKRNETRSNLYLQGIIIAIVLGIAFGLFFEAIVNLIIWLIKLIIKHWKRILIGLVVLLIARKVLLRGKRK